MPVRLPPVPRFTRPRQPPPPRLRPPKPGPLRPFRPRSSRKPLPRHQSSGFPQPAFPLRPLPTRSRRRRTATARRSPSKDAVNNASIVSRGSTAGRVTVGTKAGRTGLTAAIIATDRDRVQASRSVIVRRRARADNSTATHSRVGEIARHKWTVTARLRTGSTAASAASTEPQFGEGIVEVSGKGFGFLREAKRNFVQTPADVFVTPEVCRKYNLRDGQWIKGEVRRVLARPAAFPPDRPQRRGPGKVHEPAQFRRTDDASTRRSASGSKPFPSVTRRASWT